MSTVQAAAALAAETAERSGHNLSPSRRAFLVEHAQKPGWTTGRMAAELGVPPYIVSGWLARRDVAGAIQRHTFERVREGIAHLANAPRVRTSPPPHDHDTESEPAPAPPASTPEPPSGVAQQSEPYIGVEVAEGGAILTPELKAALVGKVRALCAEQGKAVMRNELRAELRELVIDSVRRAFAELVEALAPLTSEAEAGDGEERRHA